MSYELRDFYDASVIADIARDLKRAYPAFDVRAFTKQCLDGLAPLSLTGRAAHIAAAMRQRRTIPKVFKLKRVTVTRAAAVPIRIVIKLAEFGEFQLTRDSGCVQATASWNSTLIASNGKTTRPSSLRSRTPAFKSAVMSP